MPETLDEIWDRLCDCLSITNRAQEISKQFGSIKTNEDRVQIALKHLSEFDILQFNTSADKNGSKSASKSVELRNAGNKAFAKVNPNLRDAMSFYTRSAAFSPYPESKASCSEELTLAFANRSAVLLTLTRYEDCLNDIERALSFNYPDTLKYKLLERKGKCLHEMKKFKDASKSFHEALVALQLATLPEDKLESKMSELKRLEQTSLSSPSQLIETDKSVKFEPKKSFGPHREIPCASDCLEIKYCKEMGRYIEAAKDIKPGDVLLIENPYASILIPEFYSTHCFHCLKRFDVLLPCKRCALAMFCSENCRSVSWKKYHWLECPLLAFLIPMEMDKIWLLALRIIAINTDQHRGVKKFYKMVKELEQSRFDDERIKGFDENGQYVSSHYRTMHFLIGNTDARSDRDLYRRSVKAACILECLVKNSKIFKGKSSQKEPDMKMFIGGMLLHLLQNLACNAHSVTDQVSSKSVRIPQNCEFGAAAYTALSLINHSCDPNVSRTYHDGDVGVVFAVRPIKKGEQITDNYRHHYCLEPVESRLQGLGTQYYFTCQCQACVENWPLYKQVAVRKKVFTCSQCRAVLAQQPYSGGKGVVVSCGTCDSKHDMKAVEKKLQKSVDTFKKVYEALLSGSQEDFTTELSQQLIFLDQHIQRPCGIFCDLQETLKECLMRKSNFYIM